MIKKLQRKFILINMSLVFLVLCIVFGVLFYTSYRHQKAESLMAMEQMLNRLDKKEPPGGSFGEKGSDRMLASTPVFCVLLDAEGNLSQVRAEGGEVSNEVLQAAVGQALADGRRSGLLSSLGLRFLRGDNAGGERGSILLAFADTGGERRALGSLLLTSLLVGAGGLTAFFFISLFLSRWVLRPVKNAFEQQRQFIADASHELKTPLTVILANTNILASHRSDPIEQQMKWVDSVHEEAQRMKGLVDNLLFLARADAGRTPYVFQPLNFSELVTGCLLSFEPVAYENGVTLGSRLDPGLFLTGDEARLRQLVIILLDNACKYTERGGRVQVTLGKTGGYIRLDVFNSGPPLPPEQLPRLFERFYRSDTSRTRTQQEDDAGGYGLGLPIARSIAEGHHGRLTAASSTSLGGTEFTLLVPMESKRRLPAPRT